jgi:hypothetical protein
MRRSVVGRERRAKLFPDMDRSDWIWLAVMLAVIVGLTAALLESTAR